MKVKVNSQQSYTNVLVKLRTSSQQSYVKFQGKLSKDSLLGEASPLGLREAKH